MEPLEEWWQKRKYRKSAVGMEKAKLRAEIHRQQRIRLQEIYPDRQTLPLGVWIRAFVRHCWDSVALKHYPLSWLQRRAEVANE